MPDPSDFHEDDVVETVIDPVDVDADETVVADDDSD